MEDSANETYFRTARFMAVERRVVTGCCQRRNIEGRVLSSSVSLTFGHASSVAGSRVRWTLVTHWNCASHAAGAAYNRGCGSKSVVDSRQLACVRACVRLSVSV